MEVFNDKDTEVFLNSVDDIMEKVALAQFEKLEPTKQEQDQVLDIIIKFAKEKKRKVYGGYAMNLLLKDKDPKDAIYSDIDFGDIDFYSTTPIEDLMELSNILHEKNFKDVQAKEAQHKETYSILVNNILYLDITYVPRNVYNRMPFLTIDGYTVIHPHFMMIDYFRMFSDPLTSYWRIEKSYKRFVKLQKHYPFKNITTKIKSSKIDDEVHKILMLIISKKKDLLFVGGVAYNELLKESKFQTNPIKNPLIEILSTDYKKNGIEIIEEIRNNHLISKMKLKIEEYYPFYQFTDFSSIISLDGIPVIRISGSNKKCLPYNKIKDSKNKLDFSIGTLDVIILHLMINGIIARTNKNHDEMSYYQRLLSDVIHMKHYYFKNNKNKSIVDDNLFQSFKVDCMGKTVDPKKEYFENIAERKKKKLPLVWRYSPADGIKEPESNFIFSNTSGNQIKNQKHLKLVNNTENTETDTE